MHFSSLLHRHASALTAIVLLLVASATSAQQPTPPTATPGAAQPIMVLCRLDDMGHVVETPGFVVARSGERSFVLIDDVLFFTQRPSSKPNEIPITIAWDDGRQRRMVEGTVAAYIAQRRKVLLAAPANQLPPPISLAAKVPVTAKMPIRVMGFDARLENRVKIFAPVRASATVISEPDREAFGIEVPGAYNLGQGIVLTEAGLPFGMLLNAMNGPTDREHPQYYATPLSSISPLLQVDFRRIDVVIGPRTASDVQCEFVVYVNDPLRTLSTLKLKIANSDAASDKQFARLTAPATIDLQRRTLGELTAARRLDLLSSDGSEIYLGRLLPILGDKNMYSLQLDVAGTTVDGVAKLFPTQVKTVALGNR